jgi:hypothetical protein
MTTRILGLVVVLRRRNGSVRNKSQAVRPGRTSRHRGSDSQGAHAAGRHGSPAHARRAGSFSATARLSWALRARRAPTRTLGSPPIPRR